MTNVEVSEHTVLVSKPGSTPNTITDRSSHQCFLPTGISCDQREPKDGLQQQFSYAAYSATGSVQVPRIFSFHYSLNVLYVVVRQHCVSSVFTDNNKTLSHFNKLNMSCIEEGFCIRSKGMNMCVKHTKDIRFIAEALPQ